MPKGVSPTRSLDFAELMHRLHRLEFENQLFGLEYNGLRWWDVTRFEAHQFLARELSGGGNSAQQRPARCWRNLATAVRQWPMRENLLRSLARNSGGVLFFRAPRSAQGGRFVDNILDPVIASISEKHNVIDTFPRRYHVPQIANRRANSGDVEFLSVAVNVIREEFSLTTLQAQTLTRILERCLAVYEGDLSGYRRLFDIAEPRSIILVQNGIEKALFAAASERKIPTVELQHGLVSYTHAAYSYHPKISYENNNGFPDAFLVFANHWKDVCYYPAGSTVSVGTSNFSQQIASSLHGSDVMVVSSSLHHEALMPWTREIANRIQNRKIIYKLHPNQEMDKTAIRSAFRNHPNVEVVSGLSPATSVMRHVSHIVSICSTVLYEAIQAGRRVAIIPELNYRSHQDIIDLKLADIVNSHGDLEQFCRSKLTTVPNVTFFEDYDPIKLRCVVDRLSAEFSR